MRITELEISGCIEKARLFIGSVLPPHFAKCGGWWGDGSGAEFSFLFNLRPIGLTRNNEL